MKPTFKALLFTIVLTALTLTGCNKTTPITEEEGFDYGAVADNKYTNKFFNLEVDVPQGWTLQSQQQREALMKKGAEIISKDKEKIDAIVKASEITTANLLIASKYEMGAKVVYNPSFLLLAENLKLVKNIKKPQDYLQNTKKMMSQSQLNITQIDDTFVKRTFNGIDFYTMNVTVDVAGMAVYQTHFTTIRDGFAITFIYSYSDDEQKAELEKVVNSIAPYKQ